MRLGALRWLRRLFLSLKKGFELPESTQRRRAFQRFLGKLSFGGTALGFARAFGLLDPDRPRLLLYS